MRDLMAGKILSIPQLPVLPCAPALSGFEEVVAQSDGDSSDIKFVLATCPAGKLALGGGFLVFAGSSSFSAPLAAIKVVQSSPIGAVPDSWRVFAVEDTPTSGTWKITAHVICATAAP